jgi:hypothetical protein
MTRCRIIAGVDQHPLEATDVVDPQPQRSTAGDLEGDQPVTPPSHDRPASDPVDLGQDDVCMATTPPTTTRRLET